jgi:predicted transcriptional regulator
LSIIEKRVKSHSGAQWMTKSYRELLKTHKPFEAIQTLTSKIYSKQEKGYPVGTWNVLNKFASTPFDSEKLVKHKMSTDIFSVRADDSLELVINIMQWKKINHMPVINEKREIIGLLSWTDLKTYVGQKEKLKASVNSIMTQALITINQYESMDSAKLKMKAHNINCLPVVKGQKLLGIVTTNDF